MIYNRADEVLICPHCNESFDEPIGDFIIPGQFGLLSRGDDEVICPNCDGIVIVEASRDGTFWVEADEDSKDSP